MPSIGGRKAGECSFPLYCGGWFGGDVVADAVDTLHLVDDIGGDLRHEIVWQMGPVGCHGVSRCHGAEGYRMLVCALVAHDTHAAHSGEEHSACLPYLVVEGYLYLPVAHIGRDTSGEDTACLLAREAGLVLTQPTDIDIICVLQYAHLVGRYIPEYAHSEAGAGEGVACDEMLWHSHGAPDTAHLVLEEPFERLAERQVHLLWQSADVMV